MAENKRFYWIKLKDSFLTSDAVDFLMGQKDGANYVVLYQSICLKTINTDGVLQRLMGEVLIPYDAEKIQRDCKWFSLDTVRVALNLYKALGLIYEQQDGSLRITDFDELVGSETSWAKKKRNQRLKENEDNVPLLSPKMSTQRKRIEKDIESIEKPRHKYGQYENVLLSDTDMDKLKNEFPDDWQERIERLSEYMSSKGKTYKNHLATIRSWARKDGYQKPIKRTWVADDTNPDGGYYATE